MKTDNLTSSFMALRDKLHRSALGFLRNDEDADDALQDTFFRLYRSGAVGSDVEARNKLFAVLRNICIDRIRKSKAIPLEDADADCNALVIRPAYGEDMKRYESLLTPVYHLCKGASTRWWFMTAWSMMPWLRGSGYRWRR